VVLTQGIHVECTQLVDISITYRVVRISLALVLYLSSGLH
jgi:hypothetical protein